MRIEGFKRIPIEGYYDNGDFINLGYSYFKVGWFTSHGDEFLFEDEIPWSLDEMKRRVDVVRIDGNKEMTLEEFLGSPLIRT